MTKSLEIKDMTVEHQFMLREMLISKSVKEIKYNFKLLDAINRLKGKQRTYNSTYRRLLKICNELVDNKVFKRTFIYVPRDKTKTGKIGIMYVYTINPKWRAENSVELRSFKFCNYLCEYASVIK